MKNTRKIISISIIISMLIIAFIPLTRVNAEVDAINIYKIGYSEETVPADTNVEEYINSKKEELINACAELGITITPETLTTTYFNPESTMMSNAYYSRIRVKENGEKDIDVTETEAVIRVDTVSVIKEKLKISSANVTIAAPKAGDKIEVEEVQDGEYTWKLPKTFPTITPEANANYTCEGYYITAYKSELPEGYDELLTGTIEEGKEYCVEVGIIPKAGYEFAENPTILVNGGNNFELNENSNSNYVLLYAKVKGVAATESATTGDTTTPATDETAKEEDKKDEQKEEAKPTYKMLTEDGQEYTKESGKELVLKSDGDITKFKTLKVDTKDTAETNYEKESGSTVIKLKSAFLDTLEEGSHTATFVYTDGEVTTNFKIAAANKEVKEEEKTTTAAATSTANPQTGDTIAITVALLTAALAILSITVVHKKEEK